MFPSHNHRARAYYFKGEIDKAIADATRAIEIKPSYPDAYTTRAHCLRAKGDWEGAIRDYRTCLHVSPGFIEAISGLAAANNRSKEKLVPAEANVPTQLPNQTPYKLGPAPSKDAFL